MADHLATGLMSIPLSPPLPLYPASIRREGPEVVGLISSENSTALAQSYWSFVHERVHYGATTQIHRLFSIQTAR